MHRGYCGNAIDHYGVSAVIGKADDLSCILLEYTHVHPFRDYL